MYDLFYIVETRPHWYNLLVKDTHYCVACGSDIQVLLNTVYKYVRKYKIEDRVYSALSKMTDRGVPPTTTLNKRKAQYTTGGHLVFNDLIRGVVSQALKDNRQDTPYHHAKKKVRTVVPRTEARTSPLPPLNEEKVQKRSVGKIRPLSVKRTTVLSGHTTE